MKTFLYFKNKHKTLQNNMQKIIKKGLRTVPLMGRPRMLTFIFIAWLWACTPIEKKKDGKLKVVATTSILYDAVLNVAGDKVEVETIMGPGVDPHLYKATQGDLVKINKADVVFYNGLLLEGKMTGILKKLGQRKPVFAVAESIPDSLLIPTVAYANSFDPHVWFDVNLWKYVVKEINAVLVRVDSINAETYKHNASQYLKKLDSLNTFIKARISQIPKRQRILITAHDAFGYFGNSYDMRVEGLQGISTVADFGLKDIANLMDLIMENNIKAIFVETSVSEKSISAVVSGCKEKGYVVKIGGYLYSDAMGEFGTIEGTYIGMFQKNVNVIVEALK